MFKLIVTKLWQLVVSVPVRSSRKDSDLSWIFPYGSLIIVKQLSLRLILQPIPLGMTMSNAFSKLKARSSNASFATFQWKETCKLWALSFRKFHCGWDWLYFPKLTALARYWNFWVGVYITTDCRLLYNTHQLRCHTGYTNKSWLAWATLEAFLLFCPATSSFRVLPIPGLFNREKAYMITKQQLSNSTLIRKAGKSLVPSAIGIHTNIVCLSIEWTWAKLLSLTTQSPWNWALVRLRTLRTDGKTESRSR